MDWSIILLGGVAAGVVLFCWYGLAWMALHHHRSDYAPVPNKEGMERALQDVPPRNAWYSLPHYEDYDQGIKDPAFEERMRKGPNAVLVVFRPGPAMTGSSFAWGLLLNVMEGLGCALLLALVDGSLSTAVHKLAFFAVLGLVIAFTTYGAQTVYAKYPLRFTLTNTLDKTVGYALVGLVLHLVGPSLP